MEQLPYIDDQSQPVDAPADEVWTALLKVLRREMGGGAPIARILGCDPADGTTAFAGPGDTVPGFRVIEADPGRRLALRGRHRFSRYALTFFVEGDRLRAQTHAAFPGVLGWLYRAAVIGSGGHGIVTRRLLRRVRPRVPGPSGTTLAGSPFHRGEPSLVVVDAIAQRVVLTQQIAHLADRARHGDQLGREANLGLGLTTFDALDAVDHELVRNSSSVSLVLSIRWFVWRASSRMLVRISIVRSVGSMACLRKYGPRESKREASNGVRFFRGFRGTRCPRTEVGVSGDRSKPVAAFVDLGARNAKPQPKSSTRFTISNRRMRKHEKQTTT